MNKSWKTFDQLVNSPCFTKSTRKDPRRNGRASRALTQLFQKSSNRSLYETVPNRTETDAELEIEDASDEENTAPAVAHSSPQEYTIEPCSAPSLEVTEPSRLDSDIEEVSEDEAADVISETTDSSDSDCESIRCKRAKRVATLDYRIAKSPGSCGRRITDDTLLVPSAVPRAVTLEKSKAWMKPVVTRTTPVAKKRSSWLKLDESFKTNGTAVRSTEKKSPRWKALEDTFQASPEAEIESLESTPDNVPMGGGAAVPETVGCYYEPAREGSMKKRKGCPVSRLQSVLSEKASRQTFWLHERQTGLAVGKMPVKVESITRIFGRVAISYKESDPDEPALQVEHVIYIDPGEKQLKTMGKGSLVEVDHDLEPHKLRRNRVVHLGVCKIRVVG
ncbi:uncharacterized protein LOC120416597 [Culex pipiens pallens]|uniref:uncharacterized protein LOC120416597 n=1 Tax=Culex pipiens pallens TaxID=42434 RepID=UPI001953D8A5|nr:uncharacterized protein LOC120416597 [Culex pipiens pallens]